MFKSIRPTAIFVLLYLLIGLIYIYKYYRKKISIIYKPKCVSIDNLDDTKVFNQDLFVSLCVEGNEIIP